MKILDNTWFRYLLTLVIGIAIGAVFYPTKNIEREVESKYQSQIETLKSEKNYIQEKYSQELNREIKSNIDYREEAQRQLISLKTENTQLKQQVKERTLKVVKPDGTIVEETFKESQTEVVTKVITEVKEEFNKKVSSIEAKWEKIHENRVRDIKKKYEQDIKQKEEIISSYKAKEKIEINPKKFSLAVGKMSNSNNYSNLSYDIFGPLFLNMQLESSKDFKDSAAGLGIGIKF